ncbi:MAG TPA: SurA N-terminal domain-containing protein [Candidatus Nanopelagicales bacterium]|nr:SurA N-terminal domain-containing protein [Candidatus Nanopelagicales bacterium]
MKSHRPAVVVVAIALTAGLALSACSGPGAGTAATVGSTTISVSELATTVDELKTQVTALDGAQWDDAKATSRVLTDSVTYLLLDEAARRENITVTQGDVDKLIQQAVDANAAGDRAKFAENLAASGTPESQIPAAARAVIIKSALEKKLAPGETDSVKIDAAVNGYLGKLADELGVDIAPRFGKWDTETAGLGDPPNDLSVPADAGSPSPQPSAS